MHALKLFKYVPFILKLHDMFNISGLKSNGKKMMNKYEYVNLEHCLVF